MSASVRSYGTSNCAGSDGADRSGYARYGEMDDGRERSNNSTSEPVNLRNEDWRERDRPVTATMLPATVGSETTMKNFAAVIFVMASVALCFAAPARAECLKYGAKATLAGKVAERIGYGEPRNETAAVRYHVLVLDKPLCFNSDEDDPAEEGIKSLELKLGDLDKKYCDQHSGRNCYSRFVGDFSQRYNGKTIKVYGQLLHAILAWHHTTVHILVESID